MTALVLQWRRNAVFNQDPPGAVATVIGPPGVPGAAGAPGTPGPPGAAGASGAAGQIGLTGPQGPAGGPQGPAGPIGLTGATGPAGAIGPTGTMGPAGPAGLTGATGIAGPSGPTGAAGAQGPIGPTGAAGAQGSTGAAGISGAIAEAAGVSIALTVPPAGAVSFGYKAVARREMLAMQGAASSLTPVQPLIGFSRIALWSAAGNSAVMTSLDTSLMTVQGTATARTGASTNVLSRMRRVGYVSAATAGGVAGAYSTLACWFIGNGSDPSGFLAQFVFGASDAATVSGARQFIGMNASVAGATNVEPVTLVNTIGVGHGATDSNLMLYCAGSTAQAAVNLGVNFPANTLNSDAYRFTLWAAKDGTLNWQVERIGTSFTASGIFANATPGTTAPASTVALAPRVWRCNNASALAVGLDLASVSLMTDGF